jgi:chromosome segregation ATPase
MESVDTGVATKKPSPSEMAAEIREVRDEVAKLAAQLSAPQAEGPDLHEQVRILQLQLAALDARNSTAEMIIGNAAKVLERLEEEKKKGGKYKWQIENHQFKTPATKNNPGKPSVHVIWSNATTEKEALEDFKRRSRVQHDPANKDPFRAVMVEEAPQAL